jgi:hypothetical protein
MSVRTDGTVKGFCVAIDAHGGEIKTDVESTAEKKISKEEQKLLQKRGLVDRMQGESSYARDSKDCFSSPSAYCL